MVFVPALPEAIDQTVIRFKIIEGQNPQVDSAMHDTIAALYTLIYNVSSVFAPLFGGWMYDKTGYPTTIEMGFGISLNLGLIYLFFNCGFDVFEEFRKEREILEDLKNKEA